MTAQHPSRLCVSTTRGQRTQLGRSPWRAIRNLGLEDADSTPMSKDGTTLARTAVALVLAAHNQTGLPTPAGIHDLGGSPP